MASKATKAVEWDVFKPRNWGKATKAHQLKRPWWGLDTERDAQTGEFVCGFCEGDTPFQFHGLKDLLPGTYWVWNLPYDVEGMLRDLGVDEAWAARQDAADFTLEGGRCRYYHGKRFDWWGPKGRVTMLEASSFWGKVPLKSIGAKGGVDASKMSLERYVKDSAYRAEVDSYCKQDARIVVEAVETLCEGVAGIGISLAGTPGGTARRFLARLPDFPESVWYTHKDFLRSYCGGRFEVVKRGVFEDVRQYDITSAYPWALTKCPWLGPESYHQQTRRYSDDALYGSYLVSFKTDEYLGICPTWRNGVRVYSKAQDKAWMARPEVEWLLDHGYNVDIHRGTEVFDPEPGDLWREVIEELYQIKADYKGQPLSMGAKIVLNSMYGILIQLVPKAGKWVPMRDAVDPIDFAGTMAFEGGPNAFEGGQYYAPVYAGHLTALTRVKLLDAAIMAGDDYIGGHTDSVLCMRDLDLPTGMLGGWDLEAYEPTAQVSKTGMYAIGGKVKMRGISRNGDAGMLWQEKHTRNQRTGIKRAHDWGQVSLIQATQVANNYQVENKRDWEKPFDLGIVERGEWIDSEAWAYV